MEPFDIDKLIREKLESAHDLHAKEIEAAKPFVWSAVQSQMQANPKLQWFNLAAAVVILLVCFSFAVFFIQKQHRIEMELLTKKLEIVEQAYRSQAEASSYKQDQLKHLDNELQVIKTKLQDQKQHSSQEIGRSTNSIVPRVIYRTDTVFIRQVEIITTVDNNSKVTLPGNEQPEGQMEEKPTRHDEKDDIIFPAYQSKTGELSSDNLRVRVGTFLSSKN